MPLLTPAVLATGIMVLLLLTILKQLSTQPHAVTESRQLVSRPSGRDVISWFHGKTIVHGCICPVAEIRRRVIFCSWPWTEFLSSLAPLGGVQTEAIIPLRWRKRVRVTEHLTGRVVRYGWERSVRGLCLSSVSGVLTQDGWGFFLPLAVRPEKINADLAWLLGFACFVPVKTRFGRRSSCEKFAVCADGGFFRRRVKQSEQETVP